MKHKHADVIHAWADGAQVQYKNQYSQEWEDAPRPAFDLLVEYRIKPEEKQKVTRWLWARKMDEYWMPSAGLLTEAEAKWFYMTRQIKKLEWSATEFEE